MEMDATSSEFRDWADGLPLDLLLCIRGLLGFPDRVRFRAVCWPWRKTFTSSPMPSPWVVIPGGRSDGDWDKFSLVSLPKSIDLNWTCPRARCVGSSGGWLALIDANLCITLLNPLMPTPDLRARAVELPPLWRAANGTVATDRFILPDNTSRVYMPRTLLRDCIVRMAFSPDPSSAEYAAAVMCEGNHVAHHGLAFTNSSRSGWQWLDWPFVRGEPLPPYPSPEDDLDDRHITLNTDFDVVYHRGRFYYMTACGRIWALDAAAPAGTRVEPVLFAMSQVPRGQLLRYGKHMVFSEDGALHVVWSDLNGIPRRIKGSMVGRWEPMRIQRYEPGSPWGWREVRHLRGCAFLIGSRSQSVCLEEPARKKTWLSPNCVYFTNIMPGSYLDQNTNKHPHIMEFNVVSARFSTRNHFGYTDKDVDYPWLDPVNEAAEEPRWAWSKAIWFTPLPNLIHSYPSVLI